jgi:hypothetical protein
VQQKISDSCQVILSLLGKKGSHTTPPQRRDSSPHCQSQSHFVSIYSLQLRMGGRGVRSGPVRDGPVHGPARSTVRSGPFYGLARDGSARSIFGWREDRPTIDPDRGRARDGPRSGHGSVWVCLGVGSDTAGCGQTKKIQKINCINEI